MRGLIRLLPVCLIAIPASAQDAPQGFDWFGTLRGSCWVGVYPNGGEQTLCYSGQFGAFLRGTSTLVEGKEGEQQVLNESNSVYAWDKASGRIIYFIWHSDGSYAQMEAEFVGDELHFPVFPRRDDVADVPYRFVWKRIDADTFEARGERRQDDGWTTELTVVYRKAKQP